MISEKNTHCSLRIRPSFDSPDLHKILSQFAHRADWVGLRLYEEITHWRGFRDQHPETNSVMLDRGLMIEVMINGHIGYAGTSNLTLESLENCFERARRVTVAAAPFKVAGFSAQQRPRSTGYYRSPYFRDTDSLGLSELSSLMQEASLSLKVSDKIVSTTALASIVETKISYLTSSGTDITQEFLMTTNHYQAIAKDGSHTQRRSDKGRGRCLQMGLEVYDREDVLSTCQKIGEEAQELLTAENCPTETTDLLLEPDHMLIQIHESIGHPLELDRILGDERNYAGWSFVKPTDFGKLQYGSSLLNVTFDPSFPGEFASYQFDDCGNSATKEHLIKNGVLIRALGSLESQSRSGIPGVANFRSASWNRAPIDRMANINVEPGASSKKQMIEQTKRGVLITSNTSWSIDDYRDKFQFGAEYAKLIEDGRITKTLKNPNYRGRTVSFWNSLKAVGSAEEMEIYGSPWCGKGEPSQIIRVGHGSPPCLFSGVEVFGGES